MSREIKFRAWDTHDRRMISHETLKTNGVNVLTGYIGGFDGPLEFMQFTGLKDKNGKEIFEGDIVKVMGYYVWQHKDVCGFVVFNKGEFFLCESIEKPTYHHGAIYDAGGRQNFEWDLHSEVIGNIHENPDLLRPLTGADLK